VERTLVLLKPDALQRAIGMELLARFERRGLRFVGLKLVQIEESLARRHYAEHEGKPFFAGLVDYITSSPIIAAISGVNSPALDPSSANSRPTFSSTTFSKAGSSALK